MKLLFFLCRRIAYSILVLVVILALNFLLIHLAPGDPAEVLLGEMGGGTEAMLAKIRADFGLDRPVWEQWAVYFGQVVQGNFGYSFYFNEPVLEIIWQRVPATVLLVFAAFVLSVVGGTALGVLASHKPDGFMSNFITVTSLFGYSAPVFWTGLMLLILFSSWIPIFPVSGMYDIATSGTWFDHVLDVAHHLALPALTLAILYVAHYSRLAKTSMLDVLSEDYIRTARAKGVAEPTVYYKHALKNAVLPVVTMAGLQMGALFSGAILVEAVFNWPGLGQLAFESIIRRDYPTLLGILFFSTFIVVIANLVTDVVYRLIDPRIDGVADQR